jgi:hypothetical protein
MIYEYPKEFIVPVVYVKDLKDEDMYRCKKSKSLHEDKLLIPDKELQGDGMFLAKVDIYGAFQNKDINFLNMGGEVLKKPYNEYILKDSTVEDSSEYQNIKNIISDIDEEYANSEP